MARPTRSERRARRQEQAEQQSVAPRPRTRQARSAADEDSRREPRERRAPGGGFGTFVVESWGELKKVEWPGQKQVMTGTIVVIIACAIVGTYLWLADLVLKRVVQNILLGG